MQGVDSEKRRIVRLDAKRMKVGNHAVQSTARVVVYPQFGLVAGQGCDVARLATWCCAHIENSLPRLWVE